MATNFLFNFYSKDEILNTTYSVVEFGLDEGERLLKGMQELREQLNSKAAVIQELQVNKDLGELLPVQPRDLTAPGETII